MRLTFVAVAALCPAVAVATDYLSVAQAQKIMFPSATSFETTALKLDAARWAALKKLSGSTAKKTQWKIMIARQDERVLGYFLVDSALGKFELIDYAVAFTPTGAIKHIEILAYRESHGYEVRLPAWRKQFVGKSIQAPLRVGSDIANISGATLSCTHLTDGVRRAVALIRIALDSQWLT